MADFSRAEYSKNHKASFDAAIKATRDYLTNLEAEYNKYWEEVETLRKERAALIENAIKVLKNNNIKLGKQLCRCNNEELNVELKRSLPHLGFNDLEEIQVSIVKINMRYDKLVELSTNLHRIYNELAKFRAPEKDKDEEVVINFQSVKKSRQEQISEKVVPIAKATKNDEELEEVVDHHKAPDSVIMSLNEHLDANSKKMEEDSKEAQVMSSIIEEEDLQATTEQTAQESDLTHNIEDLIPILEDAEEPLNTSTKSADVEHDYDEKATSSASNRENDEMTSSNANESSEYVEYKLTNDVTLENIAEGVYGRKDLWTGLYRYDKNKGIIDRLAAQHKTTSEAICTEPGYLNGIELKFPIELNIYEPITEEKEAKKAA